MKRKIVMCCLLMCVSILTACDKKTVSSVETSESIVEEENDKVVVEESVQTQEVVPTERMEEEEEGKLEVPETQYTEPKIHFMENTFLDTTGALEGLAVVQDATSGLWGFVDSTGEYVIEPV